MKFIFIYTKYIYTHELLCYFHEAKVSRKHDLENGATIYYNRYYTQGIKIPIPFLKRNIFLGKKRRHINC